MPQLFKVHFHCHRFATILASLAHLILMSRRNGKKLAAAAIAESRMSMMMMENNTFRSADAQIKIVINRDCGSFRLSRSALTRLAELKGIKIRVQREDPSRGIFYEMYRVVNADGTETRYDLQTLPRDDAALVQVVEEFGAQANTAGSELSVVAVPAGTSWRILSVAGFEIVISDNRLPGDTDLSKQ